MSAASLRISPASLATPERLDFSKLVPIRLAAEKLKMHIDSLSRLCRGQLARERRAFLATPPEGGRPQWFIHNSYDPALRGDDDKARNTHSDLAAFTEKQRSQALQRKACVDRLRNLRVNVAGSMKSAEPRLIEQLRCEFPELPISRSGLHEWDKRYRSPSDLVNLIDRRGGNQLEPASVEAWDAFRDLFLHQNQPSIRFCWREVARLALANGWEWCSYHACRRQLDSRIPPQTQASRRKPATYRQQLAPFTSQDVESWRAGETWIGDHKQLDLLCRWGKSVIRPWLTAWMDWRTRKLVGWVLSDQPNSTTILGALRHGLMEPANMGGPRHLHIDNGRDYDAWLFHGQTKKQRLARIKPNLDEPKAVGIFGILGITPHFSIAYNPNGKGRLERWFRTLESFCKTFDTYTGDGIDNKPEQLNEIASNWRSVPAFETVQRRMVDHITGYNGRSDHSIEDLSDDGETISPADAFARWCDTKRVMAGGPQALDALLMHWHRPTTVTRNGIALNLCGRVLHFGQTEIALAPFKALNKSDRPTVRVAFDPHDLRSIRVFDGQFRFVCIAPMNEVGGLAGRISKEHIAQTSRNKTAYDRAQRHVAQHSLTQTLTAEEQAAEVAATERRYIEPAAMQIIQTPLDGQGKQLRREELRTAVGAESVSPPRRRMMTPSERFAGIRPRSRDDRPTIDYREKMRSRNPDWTSGGKP